MQGPKNTHSRFLTQQPQRRKRAGSGHFNLPLDLSLRAARQVTAGCPGSTRPHRSMNAGSGSPPTAGRVSPRASPRPARPRSSRSPRRRGCRCGGPRALAGLAPAPHSLVVLLCHRARSPLPGRRTGLSGWDSTPDPGGRRRRRAARGGRRWVRSGGPDGLGSLFSL